MNILCGQIGQELSLQEQKSEWEERRKEGRFVKAGDGGPARNGRLSPWLGFLLGRFPWALHLPCACLLLHLRVYTIG